MSSKQVIELLDLAKEKGVDLNPGYVYRESIGFGLFRSYSKMYALTHVCMKFLNPKPPRTDSNIVFNIGIHYLDLVGNILGYPRSLCCKFVNNWGKINLFYKDFTLDISLANNTAVKDRHAILVHNKGVSTKKVDFDKNDWDILKRSIEKFVSDGNKYYDNVVGVRLCELCEESNKTGDVISCDKEKRN
jgi:predicted dehydrogenase